MNENTENEALTVERVCLELTAVRDKLIGNDGESVISAQMFELELFGERYNGGMESVALNDGNVYLVLELPFGHKFPLQETGAVRVGFSAIRNGEVLN